MHWHWKCLGSLLFSQPGPFRVLFLYKGWSLNGHLKLLWDAFEIDIITLWIYGFRSRVESSSVKGQGLRVSKLKTRVSGVRSLCLSIGPRDSGLQSWVLGLGTRNSVLGSQVSVLESWVSGLRSWFSGLGTWDPGLRSQTLWTPNNNSLYK